MALIRLASVSLLVLLAAPSAPAQSSRSVYCCEDGRSQQICGDVLPSACFGRAYKEMSPYGAVRREVAAPLSARELAAREAADRERRESAVRALQQRRQDEALLETYTGLEDVDVREARALADVERSVADIRTRQVELAEQREALREEATAFEQRGQEPPREVMRNLRLIESELAAYRSVMASKEAEKDAIRARYEADRRRYEELLVDGRGRR